MLSQFHLQKLDYPFYVREVRKLALDFVYIVYGVLESGPSGQPQTLKRLRSPLMPGPGRSPGEGNGNPLQYSCLEHPMDGEAWWATVHEVAKSWTWLSDLTNFNFYLIDNSNFYFDTKLSCMLKLKEFLSTFLSVKFWKTMSKLGFPGCSAGTETTCDAGDPGSTPRLGRSPGEGIGYPLHCS